MTLDPGLAPAPKKAVGLRLPPCGPMVGAKGKAASVGSGGTNSLPEGGKVRRSEGGTQGPGYSAEKDSIPVLTPLFLSPASVSSASRSRGSQKTPGLPSSSSFLFLWCFSCLCYLASPHTLPRGLMLCLIIQSAPHPLTESPVFLVHLLPESLS